MANGDDLTKEDYWEEVVLELDVKIEGELVLWKATVQAEGATRAKT